MILIFWVGFRTYMDIRTAPANSYKINVIGMKWAWQFEYPATMEASEAAACLEHTDRAATVTPVPVDDLEQGFRVRCGEACLDASIPGLTRQWDQIGAQLLAEIQRQLEVEG